MAGRSHPQTIWMVAWGPESGVLVRYSLKAPVFIASAHTRGVLDSAVCAGHWLKIKNPAEAARNRQRTNGSLSEL